LKPKKPPVTAVEVPSNPLAGAALIPSRVIATGPPAPA